MEQLFKSELYKYLLMHRNNTYGSNFKWENYEFVNTGGSLIIGNSSNNINSSPINLKNKNKLNDLGFKQSTLARHSSEEQFKKFSLNRQTQFMVAGEMNSKLEEDQHKNDVNHFDKTKNQELISKRSSNSKGHKKQTPFFKARNSGGKVNNPLKETSSTTHTQGLNYHKSERVFPSFIRNQSKSPFKFKNSNKDGVCKQNFKIIKRLGQGKFGNVFLAREIFTGMIVALKVVPKKKIIMDNFLIQFIRELKIQSFLEHPNIIKIYGYFHDEQNFYTVMQLGCDGQLYDIICNGQTLTEQSTSFIIGNLLDAINLMHKHKILHRDIKPENIVLVHGNVKLCDFGWAVNKKEELRSTFCGTPLYLSPELLQGAKYDEKVDLWAIGVLAFELYFGVSPFQISEHQDLVKIVTDEVEFPKKKFTKQFKDFIEAILKKNPKERLACKELINLQFIRKYRELQTCEELCH